jgi:hypothetical protein
MRRVKRLSILFFVLGFCSCLFLTGTIRFLNKLNWERITHFRENIVFFPLGHCPDCEKISTKYWKIGLLNDNNPTHLECAQRLGIKPFQTNVAFEHQIESDGGKLKKLENCDTYKLKELTHSYPYLVSEAVDLLDEIGDRFEEKLDQLGFQHYSMMISSVLRTNESQNGLGRRNCNATTVSAHIYGTTFDISYKEFLPQHGRQAREGFCRHDMMRHVLAEVLTEMSKEGRCKVAREKKQACFHITVAK